MRYLRANTATRITVGPFVDGVDGVTPETGLTVTSLKLTLMVDTGGVPTLVLNANATASAGDNDMVHVANDAAGFYDLELTAAQANYVGARAMLAITHATANTCLPVFHEFTILPTQVYDSLLNANDQLQVHANEITNDLITAAAIAANAITSTELADGAITAAKFATNAITSTVIATNAVGAAQIADAAIDAASFAANAIAAAAIADGAIDAATFATNAITATVIADGAIDAGSIATGAITNAKFAANALDAAAIADGAIDAATFATNAITSTVVADGTLTAAKFAANAISAAKLDPDVATEIWAKTGTVTSLALDVLVERIYQVLHNRMLANESDGAITLRNFANSGDAASGSVVSSSGTTTRAVLAWA